jgi:2-polyprenyl-3-methyl-5-hydroxy-6-metoxy-1,4-benzoquinol methylase
MSDRTTLREDGIVAGNVYDKYGTRNPIARRMMQGFLSSAEALVAESGAREIHEVGCGEGLLSLALASGGRRVRGSDRSHQVIELARNNAREREVDVHFSVTDLDALDPARDGAELVVCCEVLEHLENPAASLARLAPLAAPYLLLSVPREPLWRILNIARGRYLSALGNTPGHLQHWSKRGFLDLLSSQLEIVAVRAPLPWTMALCRRRS